MHELLHEKKKPRANRTKENEHMDNIYNKISSYGTSFVRAITYILESNCSEQNVI
jgi:hypothetical protein